MNAEASGLASFEQIGTLEYIVELGYTVDVSNGKFTGLTNIHFDIPYIGNSGSFLGTLLYLRIAQILMQV